MKLENHPALLQQVQTLLPVGTNIAVAARGFSNTALFVVALFISNDLNIPFNELKARLMVRNRLVEPNQQMLIEAIREIRPDLQPQVVKVEVEKVAQKVEVEIEPEIEIAERREATTARGADRQPTWAQICAKVGFTESTT